MKICENLSLENIDGEIWKDIEGYDGDYYVSNFGRVKSFKRWPDIKILKSFKDNGEYLVIQLSKNGKPKTKQIHRLMYETFIEKIPKGYIVHHKDFTTDNFLDNFQLMTLKEHGSLHNKGKTVSEETRKLLSEKNIGKHLSEETKKLLSEKKKGKYLGENSSMFGKNHSEKTKELISEKNKGENHPRSILTEQKVIDVIIYLKEGNLTQTEIGKKFGISHQQISNIKNGKTWKHIKYNGENNGLA